MLKSIKDTPMKDSQDSLFVIPGQEKSVADIEWCPVFKQRESQFEFGEMTLKALVESKIKKDGITVVKHLIFRFGEGLLKEMGWEVKDRLLMCYDKDNTHNMMLMKHIKGHALGREGGSRVLRVTMKVDFLTCGAFPSLQQVYKIDKKQNRLFLTLRDGIIQESK